MTRCTPFLALAALALMPVNLLPARTFTSVDGKKIEAEYVKASAEKVTLKLKHNGKEYSLDLSRLSEADRSYVEVKRDSDLKAAAEAKSEAERREAARKAREKIAQFAQEQFGKQVGNGECWTLANQAYKEAGVKRPGPGIRDWGRVIDWKEESPQPGDIVEMVNAKFPNGKSGAQHTGVVVASKRRGVITVYHQNWGGKKVRKHVFDLRALSGGTVTVLRYEGPQTSS